jgi:hypothetical protein
MEQNVKHLEMFFKMACYYRRSGDPEMIDGLTKLRSVTTHPLIRNRIDQLLPKEGGVTSAGGT